MTTTKLLRLELDPIGGRLDPSQGKLTDDKQRQKGRFKALFSKTQRI